MSKSACIRLSTLWHAVLYQVKPIVMSRLHLFFGGSLKSLVSIRSVRLKCITYNLLLILCNVARLVGKRVAFGVLVENPEETGQFRRHRRRWENIIKIDLKEIDLESVNCIDGFMWDNYWALLNPNCTLGIQKNVVNFLIFWKTVIFSRKTLLLGVA